MPLYTVTSKGGLITAKGKPNVAKGDTVEMSEAEAKSLPEGTVELAKSTTKVEAPKKKEG